MSSRQMYKYIYNIFIYLFIYLYSQRIMVAVIAKLNTLYMIHFALYCLLFMYVCLLLCQFNPYDAHII
jgi:hypothetical protein